MENKKDEVKGIELNGFNSKSDDWYWLMVLPLISGLFSDKVDNKTESRLSKLEAKTEMLEKIILK